MTGRSSGPASASQHAAWWPSPTSNSGGSSTAHRSNASGQRGWNRQPVGTWAASGVSPTRIVRAARLPASGGSGDGLDRDERLRVRVARRPDHLLRRPDLHDPAEVHDRDPVREDPRDRQVVGDEQVGQAALAAQVEHQPQQLGADRDVEHRDRLVGDDEVRVHDERAGDDDPLALAARQLVGVAPGVLGRGPQPCRLERREHGLLALVRAADVVDDQRLLDELADRVLRVQRLVRVLEDELDAPPVGAQAPRAPQRSRRPARRTRRGRPSGG